KKRFPLTCPAPDLSVSVGDGCPAGGERAGEESEPGTEQEGENGTGGSSDSRQQSRVGLVIDNHDVWQDARQDPQTAQEVIKDALVQAALEVGTDGLEKQLKKALQQARLGLSIGIGTEPGAEQYRLLGDRDGQLDWRHVLRRYLGEELRAQPALN